MRPFLIALLCWWIFGTGIGHAEPANTQTRPSTGIAPDFVLAKQRTAQGVRGAALLNPNQFWTWGDRLERWTLPGLSRKTLARFTTQEGGCLADLNRDGQLDLIAPTAQGLTWFAAPRFQPVVIDADAQTLECLGAELFGRPGLFTIHRGMQVRFYQKPTNANQPWPYREIYSFYTASHQGGLLLHDVDADGYPDLLCGNYWIRSPTEFDLPWTLYAINTWSEQPRSASAGLALIGRTLLWAESRLSPARLALFRPPTDPRQIWQPSLLELTPRPLAFPRGVALWRDAFFVVGEDNGAASRLVTFTPRGEARIVGRGHAIQNILATPAGFIAIGPAQVAFYKKVPR